jgi:hypothetical protein
VWADVVRIAIEMDVSGERSTSWIRGGFLPMIPTHFFQKKSVRESVAAWSGSLVDFPKESLSGNGAEIRPSSVKRSSNRQS